jgi:PAS domain S-box-containing protein
LDLTLPDEHGEVLVDSILKFAKYQIPVIILTGLEDLDFSLKSLDIGIADYLQKDNLKVCSLEKSILYSIQRNNITLKLKDSELWFSTLFDKSPLPIIIYQPKSNKIIDVNQTALLKYQYSKDEFLNMKITDLKVISEDIVSPYIELSQILPSKLYHGILVHKTKNDNLIYMEVVRKTMKINNKNIKLLIANDVTERIEVYSKISTQNKKLKEISWFQSHELRAPVARILGIIDLLRTNDNLSHEEFSYFANGIYSSASELDLIIRLITSKTNS